MRPRSILRWTALGVGSVLAGIALCIAIAAAAEPDLALPLAKGYAEDVTLAMRSFVHRLLPGGPEKEEYDVYSVVLRVLLEHVESVPPIRRTTSWPSDMSDRLHARKAGCFDQQRPSEALVRDFELRNKKEWSLAGRFDLGRPWSIQSAARKARLSYTDPSSWEGGVLLSRVGFDPQRQWALVFVAWAGDGQEGTGSLILLRKTAEGWTGVDACLLWV